ncbi:hypothetical protein BHE74_00032681 [Ensete ventricosum]|nr:hypothetical protein BHE74_00032681 [Ensete ventricosum]
MDEEYDVIVLGTGLKECILSGLLSVDGLKVLPLLTHHIISTRWKQRLRVFFMCLALNIIYKVPATDVEALKSTLMGLFEKRRARKFFIYVQDYAEDDPKSHEGLDLHKVTTKEVICLSFTEAFSSNSLSIGYFHSKYGLQDNTIDFIGHALALHRDDSYSDEPAIDTIKKMKVNPLLPCTLILDHDGLLRICHAYLNLKYNSYCSVNGFARLSAVYGGTYMLNKPECKGLRVKYIPWKSYDATTHFESTVQDVISMYRKITGKEPDLTVDLGAASAATEDA